MELGKKPTDPRKFTHQPGHSSRRSGTIFVKAYKDVNHFGDLASVAVATISLLVVVGALWCIDARVKSLSNQMRPEYL